MKKLMFVFLVFTTNLYSQQNIQFLKDTLPLPEVAFKDWNKSFLPIKSFEQGSELIATCEGGIECKVISYTLLATDINGFYKQVRVNSNRFDDKALEMYKLIPIGGRLDIEDIVVQYSNGIIKKAEPLVFEKVEDEFSQFIKSALNDNPLIEDFGIFKSDIRLKLEGNPNENDYNIVNELINEIKPLFKTVSIKLVDNYPSFVLDFQQSDFNGAWRVTDTIINPIFPNVIRKNVVLKINTNDLKFRKGVIKSAIIKNLAQFNQANKDWEETLILGWNHQENPAQLTQYDKDLIKMLYSSKGQAELKSIVEIPSVDIADNTLLILILSFLLFLAFSEMNSKYHFLNIFQFSKSKLIKNLINTLFIIQIPIFLIIVFNLSVTGFSFKLLTSYEIYLSILACLITSFLFVIDLFNQKTKHNGVGKIIDMVLVIFTFILSYQIVYLLVRPELLNFSIIEKQWLFIPLSVIAYRFYLVYSEKRMSGILREKELELVKQKEISLKSELLALQSRINPHFLYNALNSIASLVHKDAEKTEKMTIALAKLFRYNINKGAESFSTIEQEIENVKIYLEVELVRFSDRLKYNIDVEKDLINVQIPVFLLQPLVENAIKHGISNLTEKGLIQVKIYSENEYLVISVHDNGPEFPKDIMMNYGLQSVFDKLTLLYNDDYEVNFINLPEKNIRIKIKRK